MPVLKSIRSDTMKKKKINADAALLEVARRHHTTVEEVRKEIRLAMIAAMCNPDPAVQKRWREIPHTGTIEFKDTEDGHMAKLKIGYVPQSVNIEKNTPVSVYDLIASYQYNYPVFLPKSKKIEAKIRETLEVFEAEELIDKQVCNLSGGQLQRVLLSMAIMDEPNLLLLDEPVSGIDQNGMELFYKTMDYLKTHYDLAIILISHDLDYVAKYADHVVLLDKTVAKQGTVKEVFESKEFERIFYTGEESWVREEEHK